MYFTCDLRIENHDAHGDRYLLLFKTPHHSFQVQLDPYSNTFEEWQHFWNALNNAQPHQIAQPNLMLCSTGVKECTIVVSNDTQNVLFETSVPSAALLKPLRLMTALVENIGEESDDYDDE